MGECNWADFRLHLNLVNKLMDSKGCQGISHCQKSAATLQNSLGVAYMHTNLLL